MDEFSQLKTVLEEDCHSFLIDLKNCKFGNFLFRGYRGEILEFEQFDHDVIFREPLNTPIHIHDEINEKNKAKFGWNIRNGVFCYGYNILNGPPSDLGYGTFYFCFPIGEYEFIQSPTFFDMYGHLEDSPLELTETIDNLDFEVTELCKIFTRNTNHIDRFSNEISMKCDSYFLIDLRFKNYLLDLIWSNSAPL